MPLRFGDALRKARRKDGKTLSDLAGLLGVSIVYVSDVERGNRKPLSNDRILKAARFLHTDSEPLMLAAAKERGVIEYEISKARPLEADRSPCPQRCAGGTRDGDPRTETDFQHVIVRTYPRSSSVRVLRSRLEGRTCMMSPLNRPSTPVGFPNCAARHTDGLPAI